VGEPVGVVEIPVRSHIVTTVPEHRMVEIEIE